MAWAILNEDQGKALGEILRSGSDRVIAIVGGAMLDQSIQVTLQERLRADPNTSRKQFKVSGPMGNLVPKIDLAYQLYVFDKSTRDAFYGLSEVRNLCAHRLEATFDSSDQKMVDALAKLTLHVGRKYYPNPIAGGDSEFEIEAVANNRDKFVVNLQLALILLMADRGKHAMWSNTPLG